jgi:hypothetical protein
MLTINAYIFYAEIFCSVFIFTVSFVIEFTYTQAILKRIKMEELREVIAEKRGWLIALGILLLVQRSAFKSRVFCC